MIAYAPAACDVVPEDVARVAIDEAGRRRARRVKSCGAAGFASHRIGDARPATGTADGASMRPPLPAAVHGRDQRGFLDWMSTCRSRGIYARGVPDQKVLRYLLWAR